MLSLSSYQWPLRSVLPEKVSSRNSEKKGW